MSVALKVVGGVLCACACAGFFLGALDADTAVGIATAGGGLLGVPLDKILGFLKRKPEAPKG